MLSIGILLALGLALYAARCIVTPLRRVSEAIDGVAAGNLTATAGVNTRDEIGVMASALDAANARTRSAIGAVADTANTLAANSEELGRLEDLLDERRAQHVRVGEEYFLLVREVPEEGSGGDASTLRDLNGARVLESLLFEQLHSGLLQPLFAAVLPQG